MSIDDAIKHCEEIVENGENCKSCIAEHKQLAIWLKQLKVAYELIDAMKHFNRCFIDCCEVCNEKCGSKNILAIDLGSKIYEFVKLANPNASYDEAKKYVKKSICDKDCENADNSLSSYLDSLEEDEKGFVKVPHISLDIIANLLDNVELYRDSTKKKLHNFCHSFPHTGCGDVLCSRYELCQLLSTIHEGILMAKDRLKKSNEQVL